MLIRTVAHIREGSVPVNTVEGLRRRITNESITHGNCRCGYDDYAEDDEWYMNLHELFSPATFPLHCSPATSRGILATFRRISFLTVNCLDFYLERFRELRPRRAVDPDWGPREVKIADICAGNPPSVPVATRDIGPPTWLEEQAVSRGFWRVQFVADLRQALRTGVIADWDDGEVAWLNAMSVPEVYGFEGLAYDLRWKASGPYTGLSDNEITEHSLILMAVDWLKRNPRAMPLASWRRVGSDFRPPPPFPITTPARLRRTEQHHLSEYWGAGNRGFAYTFRDFEHSGLKPALLAPYRELGFPIWCAERLEGYGLTSISSMNGGSAHDMVRAAQNLLTWLSVLGEEDAAKFLATECERCQHPWPMHARRRCRGGATGRGRGRDMT